MKFVVDGVEGEIESPFANAIAHALGDSIDTISLMVSNHIWKFQRVSKVA